MATPINCNTLAQVALELQMKFENCSVLNAEDLDKLVDLIMSVGECITVGQFNQNNILEKIDLTPYESIDAVSISDRVNALPLFTVNEDRLFFFNSFEINEEKIQSEVLYAFKPGKGVYGTGSTATLIDSDFIKLGGENYQNDINKILQDITSILNNITSLLTNVGDGVELYKNYDPITKQHSFRTLKSTDNSVNVSTVGDSINLSVQVSGEVERDFYIQGDGQVNPVVFASDFNKGLVSTTRTFLKEVDGYRYYRVEIKGQVSLPSILSLSDSFMQITTDYKPIVFVSDFDVSTVSLGSITMFGSGDSFGDGYFDLPMVYNYPSGEITLGYAFSDILMPNEDIATESHGYLNLSYISSDRPYPYSPSTVYQVGAGDCVTPPTTWVDVFNSSIPSLSNDDVLYTDEGETIPYDGGDNLHQLREKDGFIVVGKVFRVSEFGVIGNVNTCLSEGSIYEVAIGTCADGVGVDLTWVSAYVNLNGNPSVGVGSSVYLDSAMTIPASGQIGGGSGKDFRLKINIQNPDGTFGEWLTLNQEFRMESDGTINQANDCTI